MDNATRPGMPWMLRSSGNTGILWMRTLEHKEQSIR